MLAAHLCRASRETLKAKATALRRISTTESQHRPGLRTISSSRTIRKANVEEGDINISYLNRTRTVQHLENLLQQMSSEQSNIMWLDTELAGLEKQIEEEARSIAAMRKVLQDNYCCLDASKADLNSQIGFFRE
jgi:uncharacterized protein involved in exopolysaccharide biosynthesis